MKITKKDLKKLVTEALDSRLAKAKSKANFKDSKPFEKKAARRAERRYGDSISNMWRTRHEEEYANDPAWDSDSDINDPEDITDQDIADAKRYAGNDDKAQAKYLGISVEDLIKIKNDMDDWYEERHYLDQEAFLEDDDPDTNDDGMLSVGELVKMTQDIASDLEVNENKMKITRKQLRQIIQEELCRLNEQDSKPKVIRVFDEPITPYLVGVTGKVKIVWDDIPHVHGEKTETPCYDIGQKLDTDWQKAFSRTYRDFMKNPRIVHCKTGEILVMTPPEYYDE